MGFRWGSGEFEVVLSSEPNGSWWGQRVPCSAEKILVPSCWYIRGVKDFDQRTLEKDFFFLGDRGAGSTDWRTGTAIRARPAQKET